MPTPEKLFKKLFGVLRFWGAFTGPLDSFQTKTSENLDELSGDFRIFRNPPNFEELEKIFLLNRFLKFRIFSKAMDLNRSFLQSYRHTPRLAYPPRLIPEEDFAKNGIHRPTFGGSALPFIHPRADSSVRKSCTLVSALSILRFGFAIALSCRGGAVVRPEHGIDQQPVAWRGTTPPRGLAVLPESPDHGSAR